MKTHFIYYRILLIIVPILFLVSCKKELTGEDNAQEVITTMQLTFTPQSGGNSVSYKFDDPDGPGGNNPVKDQIILSAGVTYDVVLQLLNKTTEPVEDVTLEVEKDGEAHHLYYEPSPTSNLTVSNLSNDVNGLPLGVKSVWKTGAAGSGTIKITLRHYPGFPPDKLANDPVDSPKSSTDVEVEFDTIIQ